SLKRPAARRRMEKSDGVDSALERRVQVVERLGGRPPHAWRRHPPQPQLANHLFRDVRLPLGMRRVEAHERQTAGLALVVMTADAILLHYGCLNGGRLTGVC